MKKALLISMMMVPAFSLAAVQLRAGGDAKASFEAVGRPSLLKIKGEGSPVTGHLQLDGDKVSGRFEVDVDRFDTGIDLRNRHMKENYLKTKDFPKAIVDIASVQLPAGWTLGQDLRDAPFKGELTLKGVTKPVEGKVTAKGANLDTEASFVISLNDFDVDVPKYMGVTVADTVNVTVRIPAFEKTATETTAATETKKPAAKAGKTK